MNIPDLTTMIGNLSRSLFPVQHLIAGFAYLLGLVFIFTALTKFRSISDHRMNSPSHEKTLVALAFLLGGAALVFLPSALDLMSNTVFGIGNILQYSDYKPYDIKSAMELLIRTFGLLWFVRGCVLLMHSSEPGGKEGSKGLTFLFAGILAMNFKNTVLFLLWLLDGIIHLTTNSKPK